MLVVQLAFVLLLMAGLVATWSFVRARGLRRTAPFWVIAAEAVLAVPWILFPLLFLVSLAGGHRVVLLATQAALAVAGAAWIWTRRTQVAAALRALPARLRGDLPYAVAVAAVVLFVLWGWVMPFPEAFNGHQHDLVSLLRHMWATGDYVFLAPTDVTYDNNILIWPAPFPSFLSLFTFHGIDVIGLRP